MVERNKPPGDVVGHFVYYYIACQKSQNWLEPVRVEFGEKEKHVQLLLNLVLSF